MKIIKLLLLMCISFSILGCKSGIHLIDNGMTLINWSIDNPDVLENIDDYYEEYNLPYMEKGAVFLILDSELKDGLDNYYISHYISLSSIYNYPISFYFEYKNRPVFVYIKNGPFVNPRNYPKDVVLNLFEPALDNNWHRKYNKLTDSYEFFGISINSHPKFWRVEKGQIIILDYSEIDDSKSIYGISDFSYLDYDNLDNFRTDFSELKK